MYPYTHSLAAYVFFQELDLLAETWYTIWWKMISSTRLDYGCRIMEVVININYNTGFE